MANSLKLPRKLTGFLVGVMTILGIGFGLDALLRNAGAAPLSSTWVIAIGVGTMIGLGIMNTGGKRLMSLADDATRRDALAMTPPAGQGLVVVFREGLMGGKNGINLVLDGREMTQLMSPQFSTFDVAPGAHVLTARLAGSMNAGSKPGEMPLTIAAGQTQMFRVTLAQKLTTANVVVTPVENIAATVPKLAKMKMVLAAA